MKTIVRIKIIGEREGWLYISAVQKYVRILQSMPPRLSELVFEKIRPIKRSEVIDEGFNDETNIHRFTYVYNICGLYKINDQLFFNYGIDMNKINLNSLPNWPNENSFGKVV